MILDVKQALAAYTAVRQHHVSTVTALSTGGGAIAASGAMIAGAGLAMAAGLIAATNAAAQFDKRLDFFGAVSGATGKQMDLIRAKAIQLGNDTIYSANQIADSFVELSKSGVTTQGVLDGIGEAVAHLGSATDMPLTDAAKSLTTVLNTFGISAKDSVTVVDQLAGAANASAIDVTDLITTLTYAGASAKVAGISFQDINAAIALLGERGIKGSKAGTGLRQMLDKLLAPTTKGTKALAELGIITKDGSNKLLDMQGNLKPIPQLLDILNGATGKLSTSDKVDILGKIFPITSLPTILNLLDAGSAGIARLNGEIGKTTAMDIAGKRLDNLAGDVEILRGNFETLTITAGGSFQNFARQIVQGATQIVQFLQNLTPQFQAVTLYIAAATSAILIIVGAVGLFAGSLLNIIALAIRVSSALTALMAILRAAGPVVSFFMLSFIPGPLKIVLLLIGLIAAALTFFFTQTEQGRAVWAQLMATIQTAIATVLPLVLQFIQSIGPFLAQAIQLVMPLLAALGQFLMGVLAPFIPIITNALMLLGAAFSGIGQNASGLGGIATIIAQVLSGIVSAIPIIITTLAGILVLLIQTIVGFIPQMLAAGLQLFLSLVNTLLQVGPPILNAVIQVIIQVLTALIGMLPTLVQGALTLFTGLVTALVTLLPIIIAALLNLILSLIAALVTLLPTLITGAIQLFTGLLQGLIQILPQLLTGIVNMVLGLVQALITLLPTLIEGAVQLFMALILALIQIIPMLITTIIGLIPTIITTLVTLIPALLNGAIQLFLAIVKALPKIIPQLITAIINLIPVLVNALISLIPMLIQAGIQLFMGLVKAVSQAGPPIVAALGQLGKQMIDGLVKGIQNMAKNVLKVVGDVIGGAVNFAKGLLGIKSPSRVFMGIGVNTILGLINGISNTRGKLNNELESVANDMTKFYEQVGAAAAFDASLNVGTTVGVETPSLQSQLDTLSGTLQAIAEKDTFNVEKLEINNPEPEPASDSIPDAIRKTAYVVG